VRGLSFPQSDPDFCQPFGLEMCRGVAIARRLFTQRLFTPPRPNAISEM
jgi:hypothetical protein